MSETSWQLRHYKKKKNWRKKKKKRENHLIRRRFVFTVGACRHIDIHFSKVLENSYPTQIDVDLGWIFNSLL